jgi:hypothetical protein
MCRRAEQRAQLAERHLGSARLANAAVRHEQIGQALRRSRAKV